MKPISLIQRTTAFSLSCLIGLGQAAYALPQDYQSAAGNVKFSQNGNRLDISTNAHRSIANYRLFNIAQGEHVNFNLPGASAAILNRVTGGNPSSILGKMTGNGQVFLVNPAGIFFGPTATVNVGSLFASTLDIKDRDFLNGNLSFARNPNQAPASIINEGTINVTPGGFIAMAAGAVRNAGSLNAPEGNIQLAVGDRITAAVSDTTLVDVTVDEALKSKVEGINNTILNSGTITADGGAIQLQADLASNLYHNAVNNTGRLQARSVGEVNGEVILLGSSNDQKALVNNTGTVDVSGYGNNETGGTAHILGDILVLGNHAKVDASGDAGGGQINIGGNFQGKGPLHNASNTSVGEDVQLFANAQSHGDGGKIITWSNGHTYFNGTAEAKGGLLSGDGGLIETSGKGSLFVDKLAYINASASHGKNGLWLLDPTNLTVSPGAGVDTASQVFANNIQTTLNTGTDVTVQTDAAGAQAGDITIASGVTINKTAGAAATLRFNAHQSILSSGTSSITSSSNALNVIFNSHFASDTAPGAISLSGMTVNSNGGDITLGGGTNPLTVAAIGTSSNNSGITLGSTTLNSGTGNISLMGHGLDDATTANHQGILFNSNGRVLSSSGTITVNGTGGAGTNSNYGIYLNGFNALISSSTGTVNVIGQGGAGTGTDNTGVALRTGEITSTGTAALNITGTGGTGTNNNTGVIIENPISTVDGTVTINAQGGAASGTGNYGLYIFGGRITSTGIGAVNINSTGGTGTNNNYGLFSRNLISTVDGDVTINAQGGAATGSNNYGMDLFVGEVRSTGAGALNINGTGGTGTTNNYGVFLSSGDIISTGTGLVNVNGTGGSGTNSNRGIFSSSGLISSIDGNITVTGQGNGTGSGNVGIEVFGGDIISTGNATLNINGTGGNGTTGNHGIAVDGALISSVNGNVTVTGQGNGTGSGNYGVELFRGGQISSTGSATLNITGTGGNGTSSNYGVYLASSNDRITSTIGDVTVIGQGGTGTGSDNYGVSLGGQITSTNTATLDITGTGGTGTNNNRGVVLNGSSALISGTNGNVTITGQGNGTGSGNYGVQLTSGQITSTNTATLDITGTGGNGTSTNYGVLLSGTTARITSAVGNVAVTGTGGGGTGTTNHGIELASGGQINSTGTATLDITGTGGTGASHNDGVHIGNASINGANGDVTLAGTAGTGTGSYGVHLPSAGQITSTGAATLDITGTSATALGVLLEAGSLISSNNDSILVHASDINVLGTVNAGSGGNVLVAPTNAASSIAIGDGADPATFTLDSNEMNNLFGGTVQIGDQNTSGNLGFGGPIDLRSHTNTNYVFNTLGSVTDDIAPLDPEWNLLVENGNVTFTGGWNGVGDPLLATGATAIGAAPRETGDLDIFFEGAGNVFAKAQNGVSQTGQGDTRTIDFENPPNNIFINIQPLPPVPPPIVPVIPPGGPSSGAGGNDPGVAIALPTATAIIAGVPLAMAAASILLNEPPPPANIVYDPCPPCDPTQVACPQAEEDLSGQQTPQASSTVRMAPVLDMPPAPETLPIRGFW